MARLKMQVVSLAGFENLMPSELSGGMIKRIVDQTGNMLVRKRVKKLFANPALFNKPLGSKNAQAL